MNMKKKRLKELLPGDILKCMGGHALVLAPQFDAQLFPEVLYDGNTACVELSSEGSYTWLFVTLLVPSEYLEGGELLSVFFGVRPGTLWTSQGGLLGEEKWFNIWFDKTYWNMREFTVLA